MESFQDNYNSEHFGILPEREPSWIVGIYIHILMFPLGFSFTRMFDNQSVGCATGLIVSLSQSVESEVLVNFIELGHWNATSRSMDRCNARIYFYVQRVFEGLSTPGSLKMFV